jgi:hypothetical protein
MSERRRWDWLATAAIVWAATILGVCIHAYFRPAGHTMFDIYAGAAGDWWAGEDMYVQHREWFRYSPLFAFAFSPLAALPDGVGNAAWKALNAAVFLAGLAAWLRYAMPCRPNRAVTGATILLTMPGAMHSLHIGQANLLMMGLTLLGMTAAARGRWWPAAALIAGATLIKGYPVALGLLLSALFPRPFSARFATMTGAGLAIPFLVQSPGSVAAQYQSWLSHLVISQGDINRDRQRALDNLLEVAGLAVSPAAFLLMGAAAGAAVFALCRTDAARIVDHRDRLVRVVMLFAMWVVLFGPATETCTHVVFAPFAAYLLADAIEYRAGWFRCGGLAVGLALSGPSGTDVLGSGVRQFVNAYGLQQIGELVLLGFLLADRGRRVECVAVPFVRPGELVIARAA